MGKGDHAWGPGSKPEPSVLAMVSSRRQPSLEEDILRAISELPGIRIKP